MGPYVLVPFVVTGPFVILCQKLMLVGTPERKIKSVTMEQALADHHNNQ